MDWRSNLW